MRKIATGYAALAAGALLAAAAALASPAAAQEHKFTFHHFLPPTSPAQADMLELWAGRLAEASGGRIAIEFYPSMSLGGTPPELIRQVRDGVVDMIWVDSGYTPGLFPRTEVFGLPNVHMNDPVATNLAIAELFDDYLAEEHVGVKVLFQHVHAGQVMHMRDREVRSPQDLAGTSLRIPSRTGAWVVEALGANPVSMPMPEFPQSLSRGVVDGGLAALEIIPALKLQELTRYHIELEDQGRLGTLVFQVPMNLDRWNSLPEDIQQIFLDNSGEDWLREIGGIWRKADDRAVAIATAAGNRHIMLSAEESAAFREAVEPVVDRWVEEVSARGIDGQGLVDAARARIAAHGR